MRVVHVIWDMGVGGAQTMLVDIVNAQVETEDVAIVVVNDLIDNYLFDKIDKRCTVKLIGRKLGSKNPMPWVKVNLFLRKYHPDIIHFHLEGMRKMVSHPAPKVFTVHNIWTSGKEYPKYNALYAISDGVKNHTKEQGFESTTVWNGIRTQDIKQKPGDYYHPGEVCKMVCVGRLYTIHKGQDILIDALGLMQAQGITNFHLDLIGDGESRDQLEEKVKKMELEEKVTFLGQRDRGYIYSHLCDYDLYVLPSRSEGFGLSVAEAMCAKVPVIVCDLDGALDVVDGGRLGRQFNVGSVDSLAEITTEFMKVGADAKQVEEACRYAIEHFDIRQTATRYIEEYKKLLW